MDIFAGKSGRRWLAAACMLLSVSLGGEAMAAELQSIDQWEKQAANWLQQGKYEQALEVYSEAVAQYPANIHLLQKRGGVYLELGQPEQAQRDFQKIVFMDGDNIEGYLGLAVRAACDGEMKQSRELFDRALGLNEKNARLYMMRGRYYYEGIGDFEGAIRDYKQAKELADEELKPELLRNILATYVNYAIYYPENMVKVIDTASELLSLPELSVSHQREGYRLRMYAYEQMGNYEAAFRDSQRLMELFQDDYMAQAWILNSQSAQLRKLDMPIEARKAMLAALKRNPELTLPRYYENDPLFAEY